MSAADSSGPGARPAPYAFYVLFILCLINAFNYIDRQILSILMESIRVDLDLSDTQLGFLGGATFAIFYAVAGLPLARLADRWSRRNVIIICLTTWSLFTALCGFARSFGSLIAIRTMVAVGEAGCTPPSHSLITDIMPLSWRSRALAIYSLGLPIGILVGLAMGGWLNEHFSWRVAFVVVGAPGIAVAALAWLTVREPKSRNIAPKTSMRAALAELAAIRPFRFLVAALMLNSFTSYGVMQWMPSYFIRIYGMKTGELGLYLGLVAGLSGIVGALTGGFLADHFAKRDPRWYMWLPAVALAIAAPLELLVFFAPSQTFAFAALIVPTILSSAYLGPAFAGAQTLVPPGARALAVAVMLFGMNFVGLSLGPQAVGIVSDILKPSLGAESLRWALACVMIGKVGAVLCFAYGGKALASSVASPN